MSEDTLYEREVFICEYLRSAEGNGWTGGDRTVKDIWEHARRRRTDTSDTQEGHIVAMGGLDETASLPTYHRTVGKLFARGFLELDTPGSDGSARYKLSSTVSPLTAMSKSDLDELMAQHNVVEAIAAYGHVIDQFEDQSDDVLRRAALGLLEEDPRKLILEMLKDEARRLDEDIADFTDPDCVREGQEQALERRLQRFSTFVNGELGIPPSVWRPPLLDEGTVRDEQPDLHVPDHVVRPLLEVEDEMWEQVETALNDSVFGSTFFEMVDATPSSEKAMIVAGTDGSSHAGLIRGMPAAAYGDGDRLMLTFNNAAAYVDLPDDHPVSYPSPFFGIPVTRSAIEDPRERGMIMSSAFYPDLEEGEFAHLKRVALDVVQYRIDTALMQGRAAPYGSNPMALDPNLPRPDVLIRDGTVAPQARELQNYGSNNQYGEMVREGVKHTVEILEAVRGSKRVYAGAVKATQLRTFSRIVSWYIKEGSRSRLGTAISPTWDADAMSSVSDTQVMRKLINLLPPHGGTSYYRTCVLVRPFPAMVTALRRLQTTPDGQPLTTKDAWLAYFEAYHKRKLEEYRESGAPNYWARVRDVEDEDYVKLVQQGDFAMFFFGRPGMSPPLSYPRFEFLDALRSLPSADRPARVSRAVKAIITAVHQSKWALDFDHNMFSNERMPKLTPFVVQEAHTMGKVLGTKLYTELQQQIVAQLSQLKKLTAAALAHVKGDTIPLRWPEFLRQLKATGQATVDLGEEIGDQPRYLSSGVEQSGDVTPEDLS